MIDSAKYVILISYLQYIQLNFTLTEVTKKCLFMLLCLSEKEHQNWTELAGQTLENLKLMHSECKTENR